MMVVEAVTMNTEQRNELVKVLGGLRMEGRELAPALVTLHEQLCMVQREALERVVRLEAELAAILGRDNQDGGQFCLHLAPSVGMTAGIKRQIRELGGRWTECRGHIEKRFVTIPNKDAEARELVAQLANEQVEYWMRISPERPKKHKCVVIIEGMGRYGNADRVHEGADWTAEKLARIILETNAGGQTDLVAEKRRELEQARGEL